MNQNWLSITETWYICNQQLAWKSKFCLCSLEAKTKKAKEDFATELRKVKIFFVVTLENVVKMINHNCNDHQKHDVLNNMMIRRLCVRKTLLQLGQAGSQQQCRWWSSSSSSSLSLYLVIIVIIVCHQYHDNDRRRCQPPLDQNRYDPADLI